MTLSSPVIFFRAAQFLFNVCYCRYYFFMELLHVNCFKTYNEVSFKTLLIYLLWLFKKKKLFVKNIYSLVPKLGIKFYIHYFRTSLISFKHFIWYISHVSKKIPGVYYIFLEYWQRKDKYMSKLKKYFLFHQLAGESPYLNHLFNSDPANNWVGGSWAISPSLLSNEQL